MLDEDSYIEFASYVSLTYYSYVPAFSYLTFISFQVITTKLMQYLCFN